MRIDPDEVTRELREAFAHARPEGPFLGEAPGVEVEVDREGALLGITFDTPVYRVTDNADLGAAIVAAHREARETALAGEERAVLAVLDGISA